MRTFSKTIEYLFITGLLLVVAYAFVAPVARGVAASLQHSAAMIADPNNAVEQ